MSSRIVNGIGRYWDKLRRFSPNARLVLVASFLTGLAFGAFRLLFNFYVLSLDEGYNESFLGTLQTSEALAAILVALPAAYLADRFSKKFLMLLIALISTTVLIGIVTLPFQATLIAFRMTFGVAVAAREVVVAPFLMANTTADERQWVFSFNLGLMMTATFVGNTIGGSLPTWWAGIVGAEPTSTIAYQLAIGSLAVIAITAAIPLAFMKTVSTSNSARPELPWRLLGRHGRALLPFFIPQVIIGLGAGMMQPFMNIYFRNVYGQPDPIVGMVFAFGGISMAIAQFAAPPLADWRGKIDAVILTQAFSIPFLILLGTGAFLVPAGLGDPLLWFIIAAVAFNARLALMNMGNPIYQTFMLERVPLDVRALAISLSGISFQFGWFIMPQVSGWVQVQFGDYGFVPVFFSVVLFYMMAIFVQYVFFKRRRLGGEVLPQADFSQGD